jgi:hypothetical protein
VKCDAIELRRPHATDQTYALQPGQRAVVDFDVLTVPPHTLFERLFDSMSTLIADWFEPATPLLVAKMPAVGGLSFKLDHRDV